MKNDNIENLGGSLGKPLQQLSLQQKVKSQIGIHEFTSPGESNPEVEKYYKFFGYEDLKDDTAWCAIAANWILANTGYEHVKKEKGQSPLRARDLEQVAGNNIDLKDAIQYQTVIVGWRNSPHAGTGHVGFYVSHTDDYIITAGGNQSDKFTDTYKFKRNQITRVFNPVRTV